MDAFFTFIMPGGTGRDNPGAGKAWAARQIRRMVAEVRANDSCPCFFYRRGHSFRPNYGNRFAQGAA